MRVEQKSTTKNEDGSFHECKISIICQGDDFRSVATTDSYGSKKKPSINVNAMSGFFSSFLSDQPEEEEFSSTPSYEERREEALKRLYKGVQVKNRKYRFKTYKRCFVGSEAVDFMVQSGWAKSREQAVLIGQMLQKEFKLFEHVVEPDRHHFQDAYLFFRFNAMDDSSSSPSEGELLEGAVGTRCSITQSLMTETKKIGLISIGEIMRKGVNQKYNVHLDRHGFYANEAVDYMVTTGLANSRRDGESIGLALQMAGGMIENAKSPTQPFTDSRTFFFFTDEGSYHVMMPTWKQDLQAACDFFRGNMKRSDHVYRLRTYKNTFTGTEAVDLLLMAGITNSRQDAVLLGRALMVNFNLFGHVVDEHEFEDSELFYIFSSKKSLRRPAVHQC